jgi:Peptidase family C25
MRFLYFSLLCFFFSTLLYSQNNIRVSRTIQWGNEVVKISLTENDEKEFLFFEKANIDQLRDNLPFYSERFRISSYGQVNVTIENAVFEPLKNAEFVDKSNFIESNVVIESNLSVQRKQPYAFVSILPLKRDNGTGQILKLVSFDLIIEVIADRSSNRRANHQYAANSVLATGEWYKIATNSNRVYKIDYNFLKNELGWDMNSIDPRNIRVYGNGGGMLPDKNGDHRYDDLRENAIIVSGESDGKFDQGDYILFYGQSPHSIKRKRLILENDTIENFYYQEINLYDTKVYYFLTYSLGKGKRISDQQNPGTSDNVSTEFDYYAFVENDKENVAESGRRFFGEKFDFANLNRNFTFNIPNLVSTEPVYIKTNLLGRTLSGNIGFIVKANGKLVHSNSMGAVGVNYYDTFGRMKNQTSRVDGLSTPVNISIGFSQSPGDPESAGWLDYILLNARRKLVLASNQLLFRDSRVAKPGYVTEFQLSSGQNLTIWNVTDGINVFNVPATKSGNIIKFTAKTDSVVQFIAFDGQSFSEPEYIGKVPNQNIHGTIGQPDLVIVAYGPFYNQAKKLADFHKQVDGYDVKVVTVEKVYNEFASGSKDLTAIRDLMKMLYERANTEEEMPQYLILYGDGSYDYRNISIEESSNTNFVPTYESYESVDRSVTFNSDDYYALLDDGEGGDIMRRNQSIDIGVGRLAASNVDEADALVDKIISYHSQNAYGSWRNIVTFVADDEDNNIHLLGANKLAKMVNTNNPVYNVDKIYLDAYQQISTPGGSRYPSVNQAITSRVFSGTLILNFTGHGGEAGWTLERILTFDDMNSWSNYDNLPLFVTATCSFSRFDNPNTINGGEELQVKPDGGVIGLITTVRLVYSSQNDALNTELFKHILHPDSVTGEMPTLGQIMIATKNGIIGSANNRKFLLLGDPAMKLAYPYYDVVSTTISGKPFTPNADTLKALKKITITGEVRDRSGNKMDQYNGFVYPTIFDKSQTISTLKNDAKSFKYNFQLQKNIIYRGKASVKNGSFSFTFIVPKDITYNFGFGKISYYSNDFQTDANGFDSVMIGGSEKNVAIDNLGPEVKIYMNDEQFAFGGITDENPVMLVKLADENGINTAGSAIGHDIAAVMNEEDNNKIILNEFYEAELDDYSKGKVLYPLSQLPEGRYKVRVKAWDVYNNSGEGYTEFVVAESAELALSHVLNYPNPFTTNTSFWFEHNRPGELLKVKIEIYTIAGNLVKTIEQDKVTEGFRVDDIYWNGLDEYGDKIGKGVYVYRLTVKTEDGLKADKIEKLVILR